MTELIELAAALIGLPGIEAVGVGGSQASGLADADSDTDLYALLATTAPQRSVRATTLGRFADDRVEHEDAWGEEDHFTASGHPVEVMYLTPDLLDFEPFRRGAVHPNGYTTAFLHTLATMRPLADPVGRLAGLQRQLTTYPEATRTRLLDQLPYELAGYLEQLRKAQQRGDWTGVTNRRAALQAAWFDLVFAINRRYHPGEKRLLIHQAGLPVQPAHSVDRWARASVLPADDPRLPHLLDELTRDVVGLIEPVSRPGPSS